MEKLKNLVNPGGKKDDEVMYGSGVSDDPVHSGNTGTHSGPGSHFGNSRSAGNDPLSSSTNPNSGTTGLGGKTHNDPLSTSTNPTGGSQYDTGSSDTGSHGLREPYASRMPGGFDDDAATTASVSSGVPGHTTHTGSGMTGTHDPSLTNKPLPREPGTADTELAGSSGSNTLGGSSLTGNNYPDRSVGSSGLGDQSTGSSHLGRDAALGAGAVGAGTAAHHHHESAQRDNHAPETGRSFPLGGNSNSGTGSSYPSGQTGTYPAAGSTTAGPHSSNLANKADPRVDSDLDGSRATRQTGYGSGTGASPSSAHQGSLGRDAAIGAGTGAAIGGASSGVSGYGPENWEYKHGRHGHQYEGDPCGPGETAGAGPHFVSGPHTTDTANRLDPHVAGGVGGTQTATGHHGQHGHRAEEAGLAGGATGAGLGAYEGSRDHAGTATGRSTEPGLGSSNAGTVDSTTGPAPKTAGPHKSDMLNKLDPRVDSDRSKQQGSSGTTGSGLGSSTTGTSDPYSSQSSGHHRGEEAAIGGAGLAGAAAYEGNKHHDHKEPNVPGSTSGTSSSTNPYSSSAVDPRVSGGHVGSSNTITTGLGKDHYLGRDAGLGAGAGGLAYEAERHHGQPTQSHNIPSDTTGNAYDGDRGPSGYDQAGSRMAGSSQQPATTKDHHYGRDAALGAGAGGLAYEAEKHHGRDHSGLASTPQDQLAGSGHQPRAAGTTMDHSQHTGRDNHVGRDAAVGGAGLGAGAAGIDEHKKFQETGRMDPGAVVREHRHPGDPVATYPSAGYGNERSHHDSGHHGHRKEEEALVGGAAAGGLAHHELSKKDEKALEKEHSKEMKQHDKEFAKEEKVHDKDLKAHEKERAKHMAAIEKDQKKHEHDGEKKKGGGLLGFLHREKPDKELKEDEAHRQASLNASQYRGDEARSTGAGTDSYADPLAAQHGSQSGVHDTPTGTGSTIHDAYGTQEGHNKLHKDPPAHVRGQDYQGHSNVS